MSHGAAAQKTYQFVPVGMSHGALIYRAAFFPCLSLVVTLLSALIGSDVDLKEGRGVTARRGMNSSSPQSVRPPAQRLSSM